MNSIYQLKIQNKKIFLILLKFHIFVIIHLKKLTIMRPRIQKDPSRIQVNTNPTKEVQTLEKVKEPSNKPYPFKDNVQKTNDGSKPYPFKNKQPNLPVNWEEKYKELKAKAGKLESQLNEANNKLKKVNKGGKPDVSEDSFKAQLKLFKEAETKLRTKVKRIIALYREMRGMETEKRKRVRAVPYNQEAIKQIRVELKQMCLDFMKENKMKYFDFVKWTKLDEYGMKFIMNEDFTGGYITVLQLCEMFGKKFEYKIVDK